MLAHAKLPKTFWAEALSTTTYVINRSPSSPLDESRIHPVGSRMSAEDHSEPDGYSVEDDVWTCKLICVTTNNKDM